MEMLQIREREIFETLKKIKIYEFAVIGGYAVNCYTLPRFSVDCDIVVEDDFELDKIEKNLMKSGYIKSKSNADMPYHGKFIRYEKTINNFKVSMDILFREIVDRQTNASFEAGWVFKNSSLKILKGKTITESLKLKVINLDALVVMKILSCRTSDIRDIFMLMPQAKDRKWIKEEVSKRYNFEDRFIKIRDKITSEKFKNDLQGVYGYIDENIFNKHKKAVLELL